MDKYVEIAKEAIESYIKQGKIITVPENLPSEFYSKRAGVFVTIHCQGKLRGCLGTYLPVFQNIVEEIIGNAISACSKDYRFSLISREELSELTFQVSILSRPEPIKTLKDHNPKENGLLVKTLDGRGGLLLPDLEGIDSAEKQFLIACQKGDINPETDRIQLYSFTAEKHE